MLSLLLLGGGGGRGRGVWLGLCQWKSLILEGGCGGGSGERIFFSQGCERNDTKELKVKA